MSISAEGWTEKRNKGIARYLMVDGILMAGGPFAVLMQVMGYLFLADASQSFRDYFGSSRTWTTFFLHATLFGLVMGFINWKRNEKAFAEPISDGQSKR
jgi:uncharacterized membrane protein